MVRPKRGSEVPHRDRHGQRGTQVCCMPLLLNCGHLLVPRDKVVHDGFVLCISRDSS